MLKYKGTYEIISPDDIGLTRANEFGIVLGKLRYHATHLSLFTSLPHIFYYDVSLGDFSHLRFLIQCSCSNKGASNA
jgi:hypothetical protein